MYRSKHSQYRSWIQTRIRLNYLIMDHDSWTVRKSVKKVLTTSPLLSTLQLMKRKILLISLTVLRHRRSNYQTRQGFLSNAYSVVCPRLATKIKGCQGVPYCPRVVKVNEVKTIEESRYQLFVEFAESGSCDSYDQYSNDRNNCNVIQLPSKPEIINNYQGINFVI